VTTSLLTRSEEADVIRRTAAAGRSTIAWIMGTLAVLSTTAAVAGWGTYGNFTDSASVTTTMQAGTLSIDVGVPGGVPNVIPVSTSGLLPGDSLTRPLNLLNDGNQTLSSVRLATTATPSTVLVTDPVNGLQLTLEQCSRRWTEGGTAAQPTYTCDQTRRTLYSGPFVSTAQLPSPDSLALGGTDNLIFTISLPTSAGTRNEFQGLSATLGLSFTAGQVPGRVR
jgi:hypothetical protein